MFCMRGCSIHDLPCISTEQLGSLGTQELDSPRENKFRQIDDQGKLPDDQGKLPMLRFGAKFSIYSTD